MISILRRLISRRLVCPSPSESRLALQTELPGAQSPLIRHSCHPTTQATLPIAAAESCQLHTYTLSNNTPTPVSTRVSSFRAPATHPPSEDHGTSKQGWQHPGEVRRQQSSAFHGTGTDRLCRAQYHLSQLVRHHGPNESASAP